MYRLKKSKFNIVADANMPLVEKLFCSFGEVNLVEGRQIGSNDLKQADILLVRSVTQVDSSLLEGTSVKFVGSATIGVDHVDLDYLRRSSIGFSNAPGCNANSVVEYVFAALAQTERLADLLNRQLTMGIIGLGHVGSGLHRVCAQLGISTLCYDPFLMNQKGCGDSRLEQVNRDNSLQPKWVSFEQVLQADVVSFHVPLTFDGLYPTFHMLGEKNTECWNKTKLIINTSRGAVIDNHILCQQMGVSSLTAVLDVWENEPEISLALRDKCLVCTPHIAGYSQDGKEMGTRMLLESFKQYFSIKTGCATPSVGDNDNGVIQRIPWQRMNNWRQSLTKVILTAYPILNDSIQLVDIKQKNISKAFDGLRKNYPQRKEFRHWQVEGVDSIEAKVVLKKLGFTVL